MHNSTISIVKTNEEIKLVAALAKEIWNQHFVPIIGQKQVDYMLEKFQNERAIAHQLHNGFDYYLLSDSSKYIGYTGLVTKDHQMMISKLYLLVDQRGLGYGNTLLDFIKKEAKKRELYSICLTVNKYNYDTINWYKRKGFLIIEEKKAPIGNGFYMDDYIMELNLSDET